MLDLATYTARKSEEGYHRLALYLACLFYIAEDAKGICITYALSLDESPRRKVDSRKELAWSVNKMARELDSANISLGFGELSVLDCALQTQRSRSVCVELNPCPSSIDPSYSAISSLDVD